ncbi:hypothetical protein [Actinokineospora cianjurensis]|uniref:DivIVA protein n=1 Tax=Actinokineospora cianjurensis TaxID=585224 RepID=A0A421BBV6_9PSEU|nr:hypothetical protein [Actinokineospora cianjurensis]RLK61827.1 hypothetical protein CLV68_2368 [Actinokineospora cianjurensis]
MSEIVPLSTGFDLAWRGYRKRQVREYIRCAEEDLRYVSEDRDAALQKAQRVADELERVRRENLVLRQRIDRICRAPVDLAGAEDRARRVIQLAQAEAEELLARARAVAARSWSTVRAMETAARDRHERLNRVAEAEHTALTARTHTLITAQSAAAERRRQELDEEAESLRGRVMADFDLAMSARRAEQTTELARARERAEEQALRVVSSAEAQVRALHRHRDSVAGRLREVRELLVEAESELGFSRRTSTVRALPTAGA